MSLSWKNVFWKDFGRLKYFKVHLDVEEPGNAIFNKYVNAPFNVSSQSQTEYQHIEYIRCS